MVEATSRKNEKAEKAEAKPQANDKK